MLRERKTEVFQDDLKKWRIAFDISINDIGGQYSDEDFRVQLHLIEPFRNPDEAKRIVENLKQDLKDLGKWRKLKQANKLKKDLEN